MVNVPMKSTAPLTRQTILSINQIKVQGPRSSQDIASINGNALQDSTATTPHDNNFFSAQASAPSSACQSPASSVQNAPTQAPKPIPQLIHTVQKGQKVPLEVSGKLSMIKACLGWNTTNSNCDVDVSAFLLNSTGKVIGDTWFVFYGQTQSPDSSTVFRVDDGADREIISVDFTKINPAVAKIVFVLTINEALEKRLNFSMLKDAYIRIIDVPANSELVSFKMDEYYSNVTSMMIGELYIHNGAWKFNAIGNGVARDLAGLCELYGVQVI